MKTSITKRIKAFLRPPMETKKKLLLYPTWREGEARWQFTDLSAYINEGYNINAIIYAAINYKARATKQVPLRAYGGTPELPELLSADAPLARLLARPNTWLSWSEMQELLTVYFNLFGNAYCVFTGRDRNNVPSRIYPLRPDRVTHLYAGGEIKGYIYTPEGVSYEDGTPLLASDVMHVKLPNPGDPFGGMGKGLSPMSALAHSGDVDNAATAFLKMFFDQGAMPPGILKTELALDDDAVAEVQERWMSIYGNWRNWMEPAVLDHDLSYQRIGLTFAELGMPELDARTENRMVTVFGVPLQLIESRPGIVQSTYSNYTEARTAFWQDTLIPELSSFEVEWQYYLHGEGGEFVAYDYADVAALIPLQRERAEQVGAAWVRSAVTRAEYRAVLGLPVEPERDDVFMAPFSMLFLPTAAKPTATDLGAASSSDEEAPHKALPAPEKKNLLSLEQKAALYKIIDATATTWEPRFTTAASAAFNEDERAVKALVGELQKQAYKERKAVNWALLMPSVNGYLNGVSEEQWTARFRPLLAGVVEQQTTQLATQFGIAFDVQNLMALEWFDNYTMKFAQEIAATSSVEINALLQKAMYEGWTIPEMQEQLTILFDAWRGDATDAQRAQWALDRLPPRRTELIARDQTLRSSNAGTHALYKDWGVRKKEWYSTPDSRTRDSHRVGAAWGQEPLVVGMDEPFMIGSSALQYPGDPGGALEDVIQCRCTSLPVLSEGEIVGE